MKYAPVSGTLPLPATTIGVEVDDTAMPLPGVEVAVEVARFTRVDLVNVPKLLSNFIVKHNDYDYDHDASAPSQPQPREAGGQFAVKPMSLFCEKRKFCSTPVLKW